MGDWLTVAYFAVGLLLFGGLIQTLPDDKRTDARLVKFLVFSLVAWPALIVIGVGAALAARLGVGADSE
jgi:hypothetical protein